MFSYVVGAGSLWKRGVAELQWQPRCLPGAESPDPARSRACSGTRCRGRQGRVPRKAGVRERSAERTGSLQPPLRAFPHRSLQMAVLPTALLSCDGAGNKSLEEKRMGGHSEKANDLLLPCFIKVPVDELCTHRTSSEIFIVSF